MTAILRALRRAAGFWKAREREGCQPLAWLARLLVLFAAGVGGAVAAEPACYDYSGSFVAGWGTVYGEGSSAESACTAAATAATGISFSGYTYTHTFAAVTFEGATTFSCSITETFVNNSTGVPGGGGTRAFSGTKTPTDCPEGPCEANAGQDAFIGMQAPLGDSCVGGCTVNITAGLSTVRCNASGACTDTWMAQSTYTGAECTVEPEAKQGNCVSGSFGRMCIKEDPAGEDNCGIFNGDRVCVDSIESGCQSFASGGMACVVEGPGATEDVPDDGAGGDAEPQMQVEKDGKVVNYYNSSTVSSSSSTIITGEAGGSNGGDGDEGGDGDGSTCEGEFCGHDFPELEDIGTMEDALQNFWDGLSETPIIGAALGWIPATPSSTACPEGWAQTINAGAFGTFEVDFTFICGLWLSIAPILNAVFLAGAGLLAFRILFSA